MFYSVKSRKIPDSRFKRIKKLNFWNLLLFSFGIIIWFFSGLFLTASNFMGKILPFSIMVLKENDLFGFIFFTIFLIGLMFLFSRLYRILNNTKFNKLNIKTGEIELDKNIDASILNKHLDEIIYFFEVTNFNVVIIEDLDRFNNTDIFTKLREINLLLNESSQIDRDINFIYAIKDDIFTNDKIRTKFFDFIIPVIPVINSTNSKEILLKKLNTNDPEKTVSKNLIEDISWYIDDMRVLKNIYNEFIIYKRKLENINLNLDKLFSVIIYKNLYPDDFSKLQKNEGMIYDVFSNKPQMVNALSVNIDKKIDKLDDNLKKLEKESLNSVKELRKIYTGYLAINISSLICYGIFMNDKRYTFQELEEDEAFNNLIQQEDIQILTRAQGLNRERTGLSFKEIEENIDDDITYLEREKFIKQKSLYKIDKIKEEREKLIEEKKNLKSLDLKDLLEEIEVNKALEEKIRKEKLLVYLLRNGYIDEMYHSYISYFYEGTLTKVDREFILSVKDRSHLGFNYKLSKIEGILKSLHIYEFGRKEILNFELIDYLLENQNEFYSELDQLFRQLSNESSDSIDFIERFAEKSKNTHKFINLLCKKWVDIWKFVNLNEQLSKNKKDLYLQYILNYADLKDIDQINKKSNNTFKTYIQNTSHFIKLFNNESEYLDNVKGVILKLEVKFRELIKHEDPSNLYEYIYENNLLN